MLQQSTYRHFISLHSDELPQFHEIIYISKPHFNTSYFSGPLFGGCSKPPAEITKSLKTSLYAENLKFGSMPTHPLGTSTVFHAGIIGEGKRKAKPFPIQNEVTKEKGLVFVSILFNLCDKVTIMSKDETYKQLALLLGKHLSLQNIPMNFSVKILFHDFFSLVDLVSPDVMYNGLPWPEEEFTRVTMERDLKIVQRLDDNPIIWKVPYLNLYLYFPTST